MESDRTTTERRRGTAARRHWIIALVLVLALGAAADLLLRPRVPTDSGAVADKPVDPAFLEQLRKVSSESLTWTVPAPNGALHALSDAPSLGGAAPGILYVGADFCPYCASLRWPLVLALLRFGTLHGLRYMRSGHDDVFPDSVTFSFFQSRYASRYLAFEPIEVEDREERPLQPLTGKARALFEHFNSPPYTDSAGSIPFLYINGKYAAYGAPFSPRLLQGHDWEQVLAAMRKQPNGDLAKAIVGTGNLYTALFCEQTGEQPQAVCRASGVVAAQSWLKRPAH